MIHVGFATRVPPNRRWPGDPREFRMEFSLEAADQLLDAVNGHPDCSQEGSAIEQVERILIHMLHGADHP